MTDTYINAYIDLAQASMDRGQGDLWSQADLLVEAVPTDLLQADVSRIINTIIMRLDERDIVKLNGKPYLPAYLKTQRDTALVWDPSLRQAEAKFEVHAEQRNNPLGRAVLTALCAVKRGEDVERPAGVSRTAWQAAVAKVRAGKMGYVQTNAVRIALQKGGKNSPTRFMDDTLTFGELVRHLIVGIEGLQAFDRRIEGFDLDDEQRQRFIKVIDTLVEEAGKVRVKLAADVAGEAEEFLSRR